MWGFHFLQSKLAFIEMNRLIVVLNKTFPFSEKFSRISVVRIPQHIINDELQSLDSEESQWKNMLSKTSKHMLAFPMIFFRIFIKRERNNE